MEERFSTGTVLKIEFYCVINTRLDTSVTFSLWTKELVESCSCSVRNIFSFLKSRLKSVKSRRFFGHGGFDSTSGSMCLVLCACSAEGPREPDESWERGETEIYLHRLRINHLHPTHSVSTWADLTHRQTQRSWETGRCFLSKHAFAESSMHG